jgi:polyribonucleotide nucleotidyltransferase
MVEACPKPKEKLSLYAPKIITIQIKPSKIGEVIGPGGKMIRSIIEETKVEIDISNEGLVTISSTDQAGIDKAVAIVTSLTSEVEIGKAYKGKVVSIKPFGLFVKIFNKEGLCHISEVSHSRIENLEEIFKEGDPIEVMVLDVNDRGQIKLSHKALLQKN